MWRGRQNRGDDSADHEAEARAAALVRHLHSGGGLASVQVADLPLASDETAFADVPCQAGRFYGTEIAYPRASAGYYEDHPAFGRRWVSNPRLDGRRRREAEAAAAPCWRDRAPSRVVLTSTGLRLRPAYAPQTWLPFDHCLLTGVTLGDNEVVLSYSMCSPLLLAGPAAPWLGVAIEHLRRTAS